MVAINFKLSPRRDVQDPSVWGRTWVGWDDNASEQDLFETNRGVWKLGPRASREKYATFSVEGIVRLVAAVEDIENVDMLGGGVKQAVVGRVLGSSDPGAIRLLGRSVDAHRNPVTYIPDNVAGTARTCGCGCGANVSDGRQFVPGHDQKAIHDRIKRGWGTTLDFIDWFDNEGPRHA